MTINKKLVIIFFVVFVFFVLLAFVVGGLKPNNNIALITVDGKAFREVDLLNEQDFIIKTEYGSNSISVKGGNIYVEDASCPDKLCVRHGKLYNRYDSIVCLPHRVVIEYKNSAGLDAVAGR